MRHVAFASPGNHAPALSRIRRLSRAIALLLGLSLVIAVPHPALALSWHQIRPITSDEQGFAWPGSTVAYSGGVAVAYREVVGGEFGVYVRRSADGGTTWTPPTLLSGVGTRGSRPSMAASGNQLNAVFTQSVDGGLTARVIYRRSLNGGATWSSPITLSPAGTEVGFPSVATSRGKVVVAWTNALTGKVGVRASDDGGVTFNPRTDVARCTNRPFLPGDDKIDAWATVAISDGAINLAFYTSPNTLKLRRSGDNGASWTPAVVLARNADGNQPSIARNGTRLLVGYAVELAGGADSYAAFRRSENRGASWSPPTALSSASAPPSYRPVITYSNSRWHAAFERCLQHGCLRSQVYYRQSALGSSWTASAQATSGPGIEQSPVGIAHDAGKLFIVFVSKDDDSGESDVLVRQRY
jgi:hypothetical protein